MIALVTGANGFIGSHLTEALLNDGLRVRCLDTYQRAEPFPHDPRLEHHTIDCADPRQLVESRALEEADFIFHLAGATKAMNLEQFRMGNVLPTTNILQVLSEKKIRLKRFVFVSSQAVAGPAPSLNHPFTEESTPQPVGDYARSKLEAENVIREYADRIPFTILRPSSVYGPRDVDFLNIFGQIKNHLCMYPGYRDKYISIIYVADLVRGILQAAQAPAAEGNTYFLCADDPVQWREIYRTIAQVEEKWVIEFRVPNFFVDFCGRAGDLYAKITGKYSIVNSQKVALSKPPYWICSAEKAKGDFGFQTRVSLLRGMKATYLWYKENNWL